MIIVVLQGNLHEVAAYARVKEVVHCSGRSGKIVKAQKYNGVRTRDENGVETFRFSGQKMKVERKNESENGNLQNKSGNGIFYMKTKMEIE